MSEDFVQGLQYRRLQIEKDAQDWQARYELETRLLSTRPGHPVIVARQAEACEQLARARDSIRLLEYAIKQADGREG